MRVLENDEDLEIMNTEPANNQTNSFFVTENLDNNNVSAHKTLEAKDELVKVVNEKESLRRRMDKQIVNWKLEVPCKDKIGFINSHLSNKKFMQKVGPGTYNLDKTLEVSTAHK